jgi:hypothetical protein
MGIGVAKGEKRIFDAVRCAVGSPLLNTTIEGASSVILNVIGGTDLSLDEVVTAADLVKGVIDYSANVIFGACIDENMSDEVEVVIIATGFTNNQNGFGFDTNNAAFRQAAELSDRINNVYDNQAALGNPYEYPTQQPTYGQALPTFGQQQPAPSVAQPIDTVPNVQPLNPTETFEPDDLIPNTETPVEEKEKRRRPRFVDFFMRRNKDKDETEEN